MCKEMGGEREEEYKRPEEKDELKNLTSSDKSQLSVWRIAQGVGCVQRNILGKHLLQVWQIQEEEVFSVWIFVAIVSA